MSQNHLKKFFDTYYLGTDMVDSVSLFEEKNKRVFESYEDNYLPLLPGDKTVNILDFGCGAGHFLYFLKEKGYKNIEGIEVGVEQVKTCRDLGLNVDSIEDTPTFLANKRGAYDMIVLNFVIEHIPKIDILSLMERVRDALKPGGMIIISTENMSKLSGLWSRYGDITHEVGYTERSLQHLIYTAGFKDFKVQGIRSRPHFRIKNLCWIAAQKIWQSILGFIYLIEMGSDRPVILSKDLVCTARW